MSAISITETLSLQRQFNAPLEKVFDAWTNVHILAQWFGPEGFEVVSASCDCQPKGKYEITIESPDKNQIRHFGEYLEVEKPNLLIFTWELEDQTCQGCDGQLATTLVELNFSANNAGTLLQLKHEKLPSQQALEGHRFGWQASLDSLSHLLESLV